MFEKEAFLRNRFLNGVKIDIKIIILGNKTKLIL